MDNYTEMPWIIEVKSVFDGEPVPAFLGNSNGGVRTYNKRSTAERVAEGNDGRLIEIPDDVADLLHTVCGEE